MLIPFPSGSPSPTTHINKGKLSHCGWPLCLLRFAADSVQAVAGTLLHPLHGDQCSTLNRSWAAVGSPFRHACVSQVTVPHQSTRPTVRTSWVHTASRLGIHSFGSRSCRWKAGHIHEHQLEPLNQGGSCFPWVLCHEWEPSEDLGLGSG